MHASITHTVPEAMYDDRFSAVVFDKHPIHETWKNYRLLLVLLPAAGSGLY